MNNQEIAQRLVNIAARIGSSIAAQQIAAAKAAKAPVTTSTRSVRRR